MSTHARLSPSDKTWPNCPGSVREQAKYPDIAGAAAIDGTGSHLLLEMCLNNACRAEDYEGQIIGINHEDQPGGWTVCSERIKRVQECLDYISKRVNDLKSIYLSCTIKVESESASNPGESVGRDDWYGTCDVTITAWHPRLCETLYLEVVDFKDGRGWVDAKENTQLLSYAIGKRFRMPDSAPVVMTIVQPKTNPTVRQWEVRVKTLNMFIEKLTIAAVKTDDPNAPLVPDGKGGKGYCRWCKHRENCQALLNQQTKEVINVTEQLSFSGETDVFSVLNNSFILNPDLSKMPAVELAKIADSQKVIKEIYERVEKEMDARLRNGQNIPGYGLKAGRGSRVWNRSDEDIAKMLKNRGLKKDQIFPPKLLSAAQALKIKDLDDKQKKRMESEYISFKEGPLKVSKLTEKEMEEKNAEVLFDDLVPLIESKPEEVSFL